MFSSSSHQISVKIYGKNSISKLKKSVLILYKKISKSKIQNNWNFHKKWFNSRQKLIFVASNLNFKLKFTAIFEFVCMTKYWFCEVGYFGLFNTKMNDLTLGIWAKHDIRLITIFVSTTFTSGCKTWFWVQTFWRHFNDKSILKSILFAMNRNFLHLSNLILKINCRLLFRNSIKWASLIWLITYEKWI